jgi:hypothetical protein
MIQNQSVLRQYNQRSEGAIHRVIIINVNINYLRLSRSIDRSIELTIKIVSIEMYSK